MPVRACPTGPLAPVATPADHPAAYPARLRWDAPLLPGFRRGCMDPELSHHPRFISAAPSSCHPPSWFQDSAPPLVPPRRITLLGLRFMRLRGFAPPASVCCCILHAAGRQRRRMDTARPPRSPCRFCACPFRHGHPFYYAPRLVWTAALAPFLVAPGFRLPRRCFAFADMLVRSFLGPPGCCVGTAAHGRMRAPHPGHPRPDNMGSSRRWTRSATARLRRQAFIFGFVHGAGPSTVPPGQFQVSRARWDAPSSHAPRWFSCAPRRSRLPAVWLLNQLGCCAIRFCHPLPFWDTRTPRFTHAIPPLAAALSTRYAVCLPCACLAGSPNHRCCCSRLLVLGFPRFTRGLPSRVPPQVRTPRSRAAPCRAVDAFARQFAPR